MDTDKNLKGYTLIELLVVITISTIIFGVVGMGIAALLVNKNFQEYVNRYTQKAVYVLPERSEEKTNQWKKF